MRDHPGGASGHINKKASCSPGLLISEAHNLFPECPLFAPTQCSAPAISQLCRIFQIAADLVGKASVVTRIPNFGRAAMAGLFFAKFLFRLEPVVDGVAGTGAPLQKELIGALLNESCFLFAHPESLPGSVCVLQTPGTIPESPEDVGRTGTVMKCALDSSAERDFGVAVDFADICDGPDSEARLRCRRAALALEYCRVAREQAREGLRLKTGKYGRCCSCGGKIPTTRLMALPWTHVCVGCVAGAFRQRKRVLEKDLASESYADSRKVIQFQKSR